MKNMTEMRNIINFLTYKYKGNWDDIYNAIKNREVINPFELDEFSEQKRHKRICIIDDIYPENFKKIYMPPFNLYTYGNEQLLNNKKIISLWGDFGSMELHNLKIDQKDITLAIDISENFELIKKLIKANYQLILVDKKPLSEKMQKFLADLNSHNYCYISEYPPFVQEFEKSHEQYLERLLLGVSNASVLLSLQETKFDLYNHLHSLEHRHIYVFDENLKTRYKQSSLLRPIKSILEICKQN